jgi:phage gp46-like protein
MSDIATVIIIDQATGALLLDWVMDGPDLESDEGLESAVLMSLFTDRLADADDPVPDAFPGLNAPPPDRRGWWGDIPPDAGAGAKPKKADLIGSRLWLLARAKALPETARLAQIYCKEALKWLVDCGAAESVTASAQWIGPDALGLDVVLIKQGQNGQSASQAFNYTWSPTLALAAVRTTTRGVARYTLLQDGDRIVSEAGQGIIEE